MVEIADSIGFGKKQRAIMARSAHAHHTLKQMREAHAIQARRYRYAAARVLTSQIVRK